MSEYIISVNSSKFNMKIIDENELNFVGEKIRYELNQVSINSYLLKLNDKVFELTSEKISSDLYKILVMGYQYEITVRTALQEKAFNLLENSAINQSHHTQVKAPMPGLILKIKKMDGEKVEQGDSIIILEAMKMENDLKSPASGHIEKIFVKEGSAVEKGVALFSIK